MLSGRRCASRAVEEGRVGTTGVARGVGLGALLRVGFVFISGFDALVWSVLSGKGGW